MSNYFLFLAPRTLIATAIAIGISLPAYGYSNQCREEIQTLCANITPGEGRLTMCAIERREQLVDSCKIEVQAMMEQRHSFRTACSDDAKSLCAKLHSPPRSGRLYACLKYNEEQISPACKGELK